MSCNLYIVVSLTFLSEFSALKAAEQCSEDVFNNPTEISSRDGTNNFIAYFKILFDYKIIDHSGLNNFISNLGDGVFVNPVDGRLADVNGVAKIHHTKMEQLLSQRNLNQEVVLTQAKKFLQNREQVGVMREVTRDHTSNLHREIEFLSVSSGSFQTVELDEELEIVLTNSIEVMSTPVTRGHWREIMGSDQPDSNGQDSVVVLPGGRSVGMLLDLPVDKITWWSALMFANELSKRRNLVPVYDLSEINWRPGTNAADGSLVADSGKIKINAPNGDYYKAAGYRLPTIAEQEYMLKFAYTVEGRHYSQLTKAQLKEYAWFSDYSERQLKPVAHLDPLIVKGGRFFDLVGNAWEWSWGLYDSYYESSNGKSVDPVASGLTSLGDAQGRVTGGSVGTAFISFHANISGSGTRDKKEANIGLRLVRTIHEKVGK